jgi:phosphoribosylaminoimidazolecarboxamide formyltransferase/IMP cyclohydrolase
VLRSPPWSRAQVHRQGHEETVRALLSVANRDGAADLARELSALGIECYATDGTREEVAAAGVEVLPVSALTATEPVAGGLVKTFHPHIYGGILARRDKPDELAQLAERGIELIDLVIVNVRPFAPQVGQRAVPLDEAIEMIEVGGTALLAAAARNYAAVAAVSSPEHYPQLIEELRAQGAVSAEFRQRLAADALADVAAYYAEVAGYLNHISGARFPRRLALVLEKVRDLGYGENPHQQAAFYRETTHRSGSLADAIKLQGRDPTFNDLLDLDAGYRIVTDFTAPTCCIVKQTNPTGLASNDRLAEAYQKALEGDPVSAFGAVVALNRNVDAETAGLLAGNAYEAIVAPGFADEALAILAQKERLALLAVPAPPPDAISDYGIARLDFQRIDGGLLVEARDPSDVDRSQLKVVTQRRPTLEELTDLLFAWRAVRHVTSNAVVLARHAALVGVGAGQASRLSAVEIALHRAADRSPLSVLASDAYFPFADAIQLAAERGVTAIIQPGGSTRDAMAIEVADRHHMAMVFTGRRHYRH